MIIRTACKPGSVRRFPSWMIIHLRVPLPTPSSPLPASLSSGKPAGKPAREAYSRLHQAGLAVPSSLPLTRWALTPPFHPYRHEDGGIFSVALSFGSPRPGVTRSLSLLVPGLSSPEWVRSSSRPYENKITLLSCRIKPIFTALDHLSLVHQLSRTPL